MSLLWTVVLLAGFAGCSDSDRDRVAGIFDPPGRLVLVDVSVIGLEDVALNAAIEFEFSEDLDPDSVSADSIRIRTLEAQVPAEGEFILDGNMLSFHPSLPHLADGSDAGLAPDTEYEIVLPGRRDRKNTLRSYGYEPLLKKTRVSFRTGAIRFLDNFRVAAPAGLPTIEWILPDRLRLEFERPLDPATLDGANLWIEENGIEVSLTFMLDQDRTGATVDCLLEFPTVAGAEYRLFIGPDLQDLAGIAVGEAVIDFEPQAD